MAAWFWYALIAAVLYGAHQIFTRMAADHIGEGLGGFVVEASAALSILVYLAALWLFGRWSQKFSIAGFNYSLLTGICVGAGTIAFFFYFKKADRFPQCRQFSPVGPRSWLSPAFYFFTNRHRGSVCSESFSRSPDCSYFGVSVRKKAPVPFSLPRFVALVHRMISSRVQTRHTKRARRSR